MKTLEWNFTDKSEWPEGEWNNEPDKKQWQDPETGYACMIHRGPSGALCGYVGVDKNHPLFGKEYDGVYVDVHGGLTFSNDCGEIREDRSGICHVREEGDPEVWWFGFDCAHIDDICPSYQKSDFLTEVSAEYKNIGYVEKETKALAKQLEKEKEKK